MRGNKTLRSKALRGSTNLTNLNVTDVVVFFFEKTGTNTNTRSSRDCTGKYLLFARFTNAAPLSRIFLRTLSLSSSKSKSSSFFSFPLVPTAPFLPRATTIGIAVAIEQSRTGHSPGTPSSCFFAQNDA